MKILVIKWEIRCLFHTNLAHRLLVREKIDQKQQHQKLWQTCIFLKMFAFNQFHVLMSIQHWCIFKIWIIKFHFLSHKIAIAKRYFSVQLIDFFFLNKTQTALSYMCSTNTTHFLEALLQVPGIDINKPDNELNTPLHYASECGKRLILFCFCFFIESIAI